MNRLIILGNGFDLAHKMRTTYADFMLDYLKSAFFEKKRTKQYADQLIEIPYDGFEINGDITRFKLKHFLGYFNDRNIPAAAVFGASPLHVQTGVRVKAKSRFADYILRHCCANNWVHIENEYYRFLMGTLNAPGGDAKQDVINALNNDFLFLQQHLDEYMKRQQADAISKEFKHLMMEEIEREEIAMPCDLVNNRVPDNTLVLDFNYTGTVDRYLTDNFTLVRDGRIRVNYIHGRAGDRKYPIIFGFGDERDDRYSLIERTDLKGAMKFIKSFGYFANHHYHDLIRFIESGEFQVYIWGHSCGLSDRTMLSMIFEHQQCKSIKIFYHQRKDGDNFTELTEEISRHFKDKGEMRKKIAPKNRSKPLPQI
jgi:hypothetical protein